MAVAEPAQAASTGPGSYVAVAPTRLLDTRNGTNGPTVPGGTTVRVKINGAAPLPTGGMSAVALNVTATNAAGGGYVTVYADGDAPPLVEPQLCRRSDRARIS